MSPGYHVVPMVECEGAAAGRGEGAGSGHAAPQTRTRHRLRAVCAGLAAAAAVALIARGMGRPRGEAEARALARASYPSALSSLQRKQRGNASSIRSALSGAGSGAAPARTTELFRAKRGTFDERTGIMLLQCSDSVQWGSYASKDPALVERFHGVVGQRYTVECPTYCVLAEPGVYGCGKGPYMDASSICKAAIGAGVAGNKEISTFTFQIEEPLPTYDSCEVYGKKYISAIPPGDSAERNNKIRITGYNWHWYHWGKAEVPRKIAKYCGAGWTAQHPGELCEGVKEKYRQDCKMRDGIYNCWGARSFKFLDASDEPEMTPTSGVYQVCAFEGGREAVIVCA